MNSGNWKFFVIHFIYFSSVETDINFLLTCIFLAWELVVYYLGRGGGAFSCGIIIKIFIGLGVSFSDKGTVQSSNN